MSEPAPRARRVPALAKVGVVLGGSWAFLIWGVEAVFGWLWRLYGVATHGGWLPRGTLEGSVLGDVLRHGQFILTATTALPFLFVATLAVALGMLARTVARARVRAGFADPFERARAWMAAHPRAARTILAVPALLWLGTLALAVGYAVRVWGGWSAYGEYAGSESVARLHATYTAGMAVFCCAAAVPALGIMAATRAAVQMLLAPAIRADERPSEKAADRIHFDAVAVTFETRAAVVAMGALPVLTVLAANAARLGDSGMIGLLGAYVAVALGGAALFRRASRIAVGADGVYVTGTSRTRFFAYKDLDAARAKGADLELSRGGKVALRLQLHGEDATQRDAVLARIRSAIEQAHSGASAAAGRVVSSASSRELARAAAGASDYRAPALTRDQLWTLVEGPEHDAETRTAAAKALAATGGEGERARLRVAAEHCAQPRLRVDLLDLAAKQLHDEEEEEEVLAPGVALRLSR